MSKEVGIKETKDIIKAIGVFVEVGESVLDDKKVTIGDVPALVDGIKQYQTIIDAVKGAKQAGAELKDLDAEELQELGALVYAEILKPIFD